MQSLNPYAKIQPPMIFLPKSTILYKELCRCDESIPDHWNVVLQQSVGDFIKEDILFQTDKEELADYFINIVCDEELTGRLLEWGITFGAGERL